MPLLSAYFFYVQAWYLVSVQAIAVSVQALVGFVMAHFSGRAPGDGVPEGALIQLHRCSGDEVLEWRLPAQSDVTTISVALTIAAGRSLHVPRRCIHLTWPDQSVPLGARPVVVWCVVVELDEDFDTDHFECFCCGDPCEDADLGLDLTRDDNCLRCSPCYLCPRCSVVLPDGPCCFWCMDSTEVRHLSRRQLAWAFLVRPSLREAS